MEKDMIAVAIFGQTTKEAQSNNQCIDCHRTKDLWYSPAGEAEYKISGLCEYCFDKITKG